MLRANFEVLDFVPLGTGTPSQIYQWDINNCLATCDVMLGIGDYLSTGLGYELAVAIEKRGIPVLVVAERGRIATKFFEGIDKPFYSYQKYKEMSEIPNMLKEFLTVKLSKQI